MYTGIVLEALTFEQYSNLWPFLLLFAISFIAGIWIFSSWIRNTAYRSRLYFALGLLIGHVFLFPFIIVSLGNRVVTTDFHTFYGVTIPIAFFGWLLIYAAILRISPIKYRKYSKIYLGLWFSFAIVIYLYLGIAKPEFSAGRVFQLLPLVLFFIPVQFFGMHTAHAWFHVHKIKQDLWTRFNIALLLVVFILTFFEMAVGSSCMVAYPPDFWFFALFSCKTVFLIQIVKLSILIFGFLILERAYERNTKPLSTSYELKAKELLSSKK